MHHALDIARIELLFAGPARVVMYRFGAVGRVRAGLTLADTEAVLAAQTRVRDRAPERVHAERGLLPRGDCLVVLARQGRKLKQDASCALRKSQNKSVASDYRVTGVELSQVHGLRGT